VVEDAVIQNDEKVVEIRDHVGINREYGAAAEHIKYDRAILPRGTKLLLQFTVEVANQEKRNQALAMLAGLKQALETGEVRLGAAGELIGVGGPAKASDLGKFGRQLQILKKAAEERDVSAKMYLEEGTPQSAIDLAKRWLGDGNVIVSANYRGVHGILR
jgi:hypothetical protein